MMLLALHSWGVARSAEEYRLGPDDIIAVTVIDHPELSTADLTIPNNGRIQVPGIGGVAVAGKTLHQVEAQVKSKMKAILRYPEVTVSLRQARPNRVFVNGAVGKPGMYEIKPGWRITEALAVAGGLTSRADAVDGTLNRASGKAIPLRVEALMSDANGGSNLVLRAGDVLRFVERNVQVNVVGQVQKTGNYSLPVGSGLMEAIAAAGGVTPRASLRHVTVNRTDGSQPSIDLYDAVINGEKSNDITLQNGDLITIPESKERITVLGAVNRPGLYDVPEGREFRLLEAVVQAGGATPKAALSKTTLKRKDGSTALIDLYAVQALGQNRDNVVLLDGDVINVPEARGVTILGAVKTPGTYFVEESRLPKISDILALAGGLSVKPEDARFDIARIPSGPVAEAVAAPQPPKVTVNITTSPTSATDVTTNTTVALPAKSLGEKTATASPGEAANPGLFIELKGLSADAPVRDGDLISVSEPAVRTVYITGEVKNPGAYELKEGDSVPELIIRAGGPTPDAALSRVVINERSGQSQVYDVLPALRQGLTTREIQLKEGDFVVLPRNQARVYVMQAVENPGYYSIPEKTGLTLGEALTLAGGPKDKAKLKNIVIFKQTSAGLQQRVVSLQQVYNGQLAIDQKLQDKEVVYVPEGGGSSGLSSILKSIGSIGVLGTLF